MTVANRILVNQQRIMEVLKLHTSATHAERASLSEAIVTTNDILERLKTCGGSREIPKPMPKIPHPNNYVNISKALETIPCTDCRQPEPKGICLALKAIIQEAGLSDFENHYISEACRFLDTANANKKNLINRCGEIGVERDVALGDNAQLVADNKAKDDRIKGLEEVVDGG